ncbi:hypothetical protein ACFLTH_03960 [Bacteroidota bacterium]
MRIKKNKYYTVVTGDIIKSSKIASLKGKKLFNLIKKCYAETQKEFSNILPLDISIFRGDSWQFLITEPSMSLKVSLYFRTLLKTKIEGSAIDSRLAIAVGFIEFVPDDNVSVGRGEAYTLSGEGLDNLKRRNMLFTSSKNEDFQTLDLVTQFIDTLVNRWTYKQSLAVLGALRGLQQRDIAKLWKNSKITQQSIGGHLENAGYQVIEKGLRFFEDYLLNL